VSDDKRVIVVLNRSHELTPMLSAIGHVCAGLGASQGADALSLVTYVDATGTEYPSISDWSVVILKGRGGQLRTLFNDLRGRDLPAVAYTETMFSGGSQAQQASTRAVATEELALVAVASIGTREQLDPLTKKFSVWS
jgi:hypothetical protein